MTYLFLYLNLALLLIPFVLMLDKKAIKSFVIPSIVVTIFFSEAGVLLAGAKVWVFNPDYLIEVIYRNIPLEMYLFYFTSSFASLGIYTYLNNKFPKNDWQKYTLALSNLLLGLMIAMLFFAYTKWYTVITFAILFVLLLFVEYKNHLRFMYKFYRAYLVCLIPFYLSFGILCNLPAISYKAAETVQANIFNIPFENHFYMMGMLLLGVYLLELIKAWKPNNGTA
jgi:hypothetical protein